MENDEVVDKALAKSRSSVCVVPASELGHPFGEATRHGWHVLPDQSPQGWGPLYIAVLQRANTVGVGDEGKSEDDDSDEDSESGSGSEKEEREKSG